jgi:Family of unknown function (DUF5763)
MEAKITALINEEVNSRVNDQLTTIISHISKTYNINVDRLLKDVSEVKTDTTRCLGVKTDGSRCTRFARINGYCNMHKVQCPEKPQASPVKEVTHTHTLPPMFLAGCPACEKTRVQKIDFDL